MPNISIEEPAALGLFGFNQLQFVAFFLGMFTFGVAICGLRGQLRKGTFFGVLQGIFLGGVVASSCCGCGLGSIALLMPSGL